MSKGQVSQTSIDGQGPNGFPLHTFTHALGQLSLNFWGFLEFPRAQTPSESNIANPGISSLGDFDSQTPRLFAPCRTYSSVVHHRQCTTYVVASPNWP